MPSNKEIKSDKILLKDVFKMWFRIPEYQRPYVWGYDEIHDLLDDLTFAKNEKPNAEYFLGSFVFQSKEASSKDGLEFEENDLLDGQQRMTTMLLLLAVIRDFSQSKDVQSKCQEYIFQKSDPIENIPERTRLVFSIRDEVQVFIEKYIKERGATLKSDELKKIINSSDDISIRNMAKAINIIVNFFSENKEHSPDDLLSFIVNKVLMIYVSTENLEDAFRMFMILNDRGVPLRNSDILKSMNLGALENQSDKLKYANLWEKAEGELGEEFDRFLSHVRTILVKEKARLNLLQEFEDKIYNPKEKDKKTGVRKPILLKKGIETFNTIENYLEHYRTIFSFQSYDEVGDFSLDNLLKVMLYGLPSTDWQPPLLRYFDKFKYEKLLEFSCKLDNKVSADWISQYSPTYRIESMNAIIKSIDSAGAPDDVFNSGCFVIDKESFSRVIDSPVYGRRFARYILLKLDYYYQNQDQRMSFETLSVEHILPQNPAPESQWVKDFSNEERERLTNLLGNLVLITRSKNTSQGRLDFLDKIKRYFSNNIDTCPNSLRVLRIFNQWLPSNLLDNHSTVTGLLAQKYT
jgi:uncharacterized protein with ParB-like and HNH nuclease domain